MSNGEGAMLLETLPGNDTPDSLTGEWCGSPVGRTLPDLAMLTLNEVRRVRVRGELPLWWRGVTQRLGDLTALGGDWDSYGAQPISGRIAEQVLLFLVEFLPATGPAPQIVPTPGGGIQVEWHDGGLDLEIEFSPDGRAEFALEGFKGEVIEGNVTNQLPVLEDALSRMMG